MADLTREELLELLRKKEEEEAKQSPHTFDEPKQCIYKPIRGTQKECKSKATTPFGFCKKHSRTTQARKIKKEMEEAQKAEETTPPPDSTEEPATESVTSPPESSPESAPESPIVSTPESTPESPPESTEESEVLLVATEPVEKVVAEIETTLTKSSKDSRRSKIPRPKSSRRSKPLKSSKKSSKVRRKYIRANIWGRYEDPDSHICFDPKTRVAYGVQAKNGEVVALSPHHIAICEKNGWEYNAPYDDESSDSDESDFSGEEVEDVESESESEHSTETDSDFSEEGSEESSDGDSEEDSGSDEGSEEDYSDDDFY